MVNHKVHRRLLLLPKPSIIPQEFIYYCDPSYRVMEHLLQYTTALAKPHITSDRFPPFSSPLAFGIAAYMHNLTGLFFIFAFCFYVYLEQV